MTLIIAQMFEDSILLISDRLRVAIDLEGNAGKVTNSETQKVNLVAQRVGIACSGLGKVSETIVSGLKATFQGVPNPLTEDVVRCGEEYFHFVYDQFKRTHPNQSGGLELLLFGIDQTSGPFMYLYNNRDGFKRHIIPDGCSVAIGSGGLDAMKLVGEKHFDTPDQATGELIEIVRETSKIVSSVGEDTDAMLININTIAQFTMDKNNEFIHPPKVTTWG